MRGWFGITGTDLNFYASVKFRAVPVIRCNLYADAILKVVDPMGWDVYFVCINPDADIELLLSPSPRIQIAIKRDRYFRSTAAADYDLAFLQSEISQATNQIRPLIRKVCR